ncbi:MAG: TIGR00282 family metallophosphoesterase [Holosporaceae bacterium]|jgi:metallophosphoesterase (TIGR00282 family)|nr:TIGR00282 family metallophosphoesterase [Holosporaceae bacterium]
MRFLICGDIVGRSGREIISQRIPDLKKKLSIDLIILNVDNATHGFGINPDMANCFFEIGADVLTGGNHLFDQKEIIGFLEKEKRILRPSNMSSYIPGSGIFDTITVSGLRIIVIHLLGQINMPIVGNNPFCHMDKILQKYQLGRNVNAIIVDFHAEVTSEKNALGHYLDGRVSAVIGTHTHIPTSDERILKHGTAYQTDVGMCGDYDSVIGMQKTIVEKFVKGYSHHKISPIVSGDATLCGVIIGTNNETGLATSINSVRIGGALLEKLPTGA